MGEGRPPATSSFAARRSSGSAASRRAFAPAGTSTYAARFGAGAHWLNERYPGSSPPWPLRLGLASVARDVVGHVRAGRIEDAAFRGIDGVGLVAHRIGYATGNTAESLN